MTFGEEVWLAVIAAGLGLIGGTVGGAISGDIVAKRAFAREQKAKTAAKLADWAFEPLGTAASNLHNTGDEVGLNIRLAWYAAGTGPLEGSPIDRIDPGDRRRIEAGPLTHERRVIVTWDRPDGTTESVVREIPRFRR
jgi:hypothetical protein